MTNQKTQIDRFRKAARALVCGDEEAHLEAKLKNIAKAPKPKDEAKHDGN